MSRMTRFPRLASLRNENGGELSQYVMMALLIIIGGVGVAILLNYLIGREKTILLTLDFFAIIVTIGLTSWAVSNTFKILRLPYKESTLYWMRANVFIRSRLSFFKLSDTDRGILVSRNPISKNIAFRTILSAGRRNPAIFELSDAEWEEIQQNSHWWKLEKFAAANCLSPELYMRLAQHKDSRIRQITANNPAAPEEAQVLAALLGTEPEGY